MAIRIGTRGSKLALWQANWVAAELKKHKVDTDIVILKTLGDVKSGPIGQVGAQGVFTKEIQTALLEKHVDLAVHSLKDLPTDETEGLSLAVVPEREGCGDALIARTASDIDSLPKNATVATGSARRRAQLLHYRRDLQVVDLRGNVDTRLRKLHETGLDAIILAEAGLRRLGLEENITQVLPKSLMLPAVGQGALGLEIRENDSVTFDSIACLNHDTTRFAVMAERALLRSLRGGCLAPVGAWARVEEDKLVLDAVVLNADGSERVTASAAANLGQAEELGIRTGNELIAKGSDRLLESSRT